MKSLLSTFLMGFVLLLASGCDEGPVGPPGPPGNANVFSLNFQFDYASAALNGTVVSEQFDVPDITPSVVDDGAVLVYYRFAGTWTALPYTLSVEAPDDPPRVDYTATFGYAYDDQFIEVFVEASSDDPVVIQEISETDLFIEPIEMKAVIIDGFFVGKNSDLDLRDYEAVKAYFNLKD
ncbi:MAG TPA: hypothetical protein VKP65_04410 [Rhodothermales bacterium]|nr:hypothetical protein [Rhodothermales bacterium]